MNKTLNIPRLQKLLMGGERQQVIDQLLAYATNIQHRKTRQEIRHLATRWSDYQREERMGTASREQLNLSKRQFDKSLLQLLDDLELGEGQIPYWLPINFRFIGMAVATVALLLLAWQYFNSSTPPQPKFEVEETKPSTLDANSSKVIAKDTVEAKEPIRSKSPKKEDIQTIKKPTNTNRKKSPSSTSTSQKETPTPIPTTAALSVQSKTNKGTNNLRFVAGETLRLYVQVNKACQIRIIYKLADGRLILLENDRLVTATETQKWIELGDGFTIEAPFGAEELYLLAQNTAFPKLVTEYTTDGYLLITEGLPTALQKSRGLKKKQAFAETRLNIFTQSKK